MTSQDILKDIELFNGLSVHEYKQVAAICQKKVYHPGDVIATQGEIGTDLFIIAEGMVEILVSKTQDFSDSQLVANLGEGQIIGEMALVDQGPRSATVRALSDPTILYAIPYDDFKNLCEANNRIGYIAMKNLAADISFKLRHMHKISW